MSANWPDPDAYQGPPQPEDDENRPLRYPLWMLQTPGAAAAGNPNAATMFIRPPSVEGATGPAPVDYSKTGLAAGEKPAPETPKVAPQLLKPNGIGEEPTSQGGVGGLSSMTRQAIQDAQQANAAAQADLNTWNPFTWRRRLATAANARENLEATIRLGQMEMMGQLYGARQQYYTRPQGHGQVVSSFNPDTGRWETSVPAPWKGAAGGAGINAVTGEQLAPPLNPNARPAPMGQYGTYLPGTGEMLPPQAPAVNPNINPIRPIGAGGSVTPSGSIISPVPKPTAPPPPGAMTKQQQARLQSLTADVSAAQIEYRGAAARSAKDPNDEDLQTAAQTAGMKVLQARRRRDAFLASLSAQPPAATRSGPPPVVNGIRDYTQLK